MKKLLPLMFVLVALNAHAGLFDFLGDHWKEEALLHDGSSIIVSRSQNYGGGHEIGQSSPMNKESFSFTIPGTNQKVGWEGSFSRTDASSENLGLLAIDVVNKTPYLVATTELGDLGNTKWGCRADWRYVVLKFDGKVWNQIPMSDLPQEIKGANLILNTERENLGSHSGVFHVKEVQTLNTHIPGGRAPDYLMVFERKTVDQPPCVKLINYKGNWIRPNDDMARKMIDSVSR
jgi:hypothetical protein